MKSQITIIGAGHVGSHCAYALSFMGVCQEIVLLDCDERKASANANDIADGTALMGASVHLRAGSEKDIANSAILVVCVGIPPEADKDRLDMLDDSLLMCADVARRVKASGFDGILISITNPADVVADYLRKKTGLAPSRVFSTGTALDTMRLKRELARFFEVDAKSVNAYALGEHGFSAVAALSSATVGGSLLSGLLASHPAYYAQKIETLYGERVEPAAKHLLERLRHHAAKHMKDSAYDVVRGKGCTEFGIGTVLADMVKAVLYDERRILPASVLLKGEYGLHGIHAGVPCLIGAGGIERITEISLDEFETAALRESALIIERYIQRSVDT